MFQSQYRLIRFVLHSKDDEERETENRMREQLQTIDRQAAQHTFDAQTDVSTIDRKNQLRINANH